MASDTPAGRPGFRPVHPGVVVRRNIDGLGLTIEDFARRIDRSRQMVHDVIAGRSAVTADMAARLARAFDTTPQFWMNMQANHDVWEPERDPKVKRIRPIRPRERLPAGGRRDVREPRAAVRASRRAKGR